MIPQLEAAKAAGALTRWLIAILVFLIYSAVLVWCGWTIKSNAADAKQLKTVTAQIDVDRKELIWRHGIDTHVVDNKADQAKAADAKFREIRKEIPHVAKPVPAAAAAVDCPVCRCRYGAGFIRVWNDALDASVPGAASGAAAAAAGPGAAATVSGTVSAADILTNHADNAAVNATNRQNCQALLNWHAQQAERAP